MYKVFISEYPLFICTLDDSKLLDSETIIIHHQQGLDWIKVLDQLSDVGVCVVGQAVDVIWTDFSSRYSQIEAAGGLVENTAGQLLCIFRNGKWDLPKGKVEQNELIEKAAVREVEEECGIDGVSIVAPFQNTYHTYCINSTNILKTTYWYKMTTDWSENLTPQLEEGITKVEWISRDRLDVVRKNTYQSIVELLSTY